MGLSFIFFLKRTGVVRAREVTLLEAADTEKCQVRGTCRLYVGVVLIH